jgi:hypothetical protein
LGWAIITHPFHPQSGKQFPILKMRRVGGEQILSLLDESSGRGSFTVPREWTDQSPPSPHSSMLEQAPVLDAACLIKLRDLVEVLKKGVDDAR